MVNLEKKSIRYAGFGLKQAAALAVTSKCSEHKGRGSLCTSEPGRALALDLLANAMLVARASAKRYIRVIT